MAPRFWAAVPAAGIGSRMRSNVPKQYMQLLGRAVIEHAVNCLVMHPAVAGVCIALAPDDAYFVKLNIQSNCKPMVLTEGGTERAQSVLNALVALEVVADSEDWVLVHDAARPCLRSADLGLLIDQLREDPVGGLLALPVRDTLKRGDADGRVAATVEREQLWHALTPQMFRIGALRKALLAAANSGAKVTDEAQAMELAGLRPRLIEGHEDNIKVTRPQDLDLAELYLRARGDHLCA